MTYFELLIIFEFAIRRFRKLLEFERFKTRIIEIIFYFSRIAVSWQQFR